MRHIKYILLPLVVLFTFQGFAQNFDPNKTTDKFASLINNISYFYVDSVDEEKLTEDAIRAMLDKLDPHSVYIPAKELKATNEPLVGNFEGVGIQFNILKDTILVVSPISGGPSEKVGIQAGDKIVKIDGKNYAGMGVTNNDVRDNLRGKKGTKVTVSIARRGTKELLDFTITRDKIPLYSVDASYMVEPKIGYIKVNRFAATTSKELDEAIKKLQDQDMESLILDLQGNGGGYLKTAIEMADQFLPKNKMIVYTQGKAFPKDENVSTEKGLMEKGKLVILIDEGSASASEIVSGAIQDWDRGLIVGRRSFGKGLVQRPVSLSDGSVVRLTVSRYYTPAGRCIQKSYEDGTEAYRKERYDRFLSGELSNEDSIKALPDSLKFFTDNKRVVYGGGGIMPDVFVAIDTTNGSKYYSQLRRKGIINSFTLAFSNENRESLLAAYPNIKEFKNNYVLDAAFWEEFDAYAKAEGVEKDEADFKNSEELMTLYLKALIARNLWTTNEFYEIINDINPIYKKAVEVLKDDTFKKMKLAKY